MNAPQQLKGLADHRAELLLAETAAWLHDMGKCTDEMLVVQADQAEKKKGWMDSLPVQLRGQLNGFNYRKTYPSQLLAQAPPLSLLGESVALPDLFWTARPKWIDDTQYGWLVRALGRCHGAAHIEKEALLENAVSAVPGSVRNQSIRDTRLSTPFGEETSPLIGLTATLKALPYSLIGIPEKRMELQQAIRDAFLQAPGDTRRPINEVTLWDWSHIVAALYKAALAGAILGHQPEPDQLFWRLLAVRFDGLRAIERAVSIPALLARQKWLGDGLDRVRTLLEYTYPLGTEVYRDENGSLFVVPDIGTICEFVDENGATLTDRIRIELAYDGELVVTPRLDAQAWWAQKPLQSAAAAGNMLPPIAEHLRSTPSTPADAAKVASWWQSATGGNEPCLVSGVRPQGPSAIGRERKVSDYWLNLTGGRARQWLKDLNPENQVGKSMPSTIWIDEAADVNGRICLIVGRFDLEDWLTPEPDNYVNTIVADRVVASGAYEHKRASFARLRRIWEATRTFWREVTNDLGAYAGTVGPRLRINGKFEGTGNLGVTYTYELQLDGTTLSICSDSDRTYVTNDNLYRVACLLGAPEGRPSGYASAAQILKRYLEGRREVAVIEPTGYGSPNKERGKLRIETVDLDVTSYIPAIPILAEPRTFMALVPADKALDVAKGIKDKYEAEMNKVRNRLPLALGLVFAGSRTPLPAILDAGRRMLRQPMDEIWWDVIAKESTPCNTTLTLSRDGRSLQLIVPTMMGDGTTRDDWYPYWLMEGRTPAADALWFKSERPGESSARCWLHARDLREHDRVGVRPSRFDFEYLDTAARRFEIDYHAGARRGARGTGRPYYLEELADIGTIWAILSNGLNTTQIKSLVGVIEAKRQDWSGHDGAAIGAFSYDALREANWHRGKRPPDGDLSLIRDAAVRGQLADVVELYMEVLKCRPKADTMEVEG